MCSTLGSDFGIDMIVTAINKRGSPKHEVKSTKCILRFQAGLSVSLKSVAGISGLEISGMHESYSTTSLICVDLQLAFLLSLDLPIIKMAQRHIPGEITTNRRRNCELSAYQRGRIQGMYESGLK